ncbi:hypothetical protein [Longimycelium tulufanense]|nr:hypothetical protein [Longimycelium tulufanense]
MITEQRMRTATVGDAVLAPRDTGDALAEVARCVLGGDPYHTVDLLDVLDGAAEPPVDVVRAPDDLLPRLAHDGGLVASLAAARAALRSGGLFVAAVPELDRLSQLRPTAPPPRVVGRGDQRQVTVQLWDWAEDGSSYGLEVVQLVRDHGGWEIACAVSTRHRVLTAAEVSDAFARAGFAAVQRLAPAESGHPLPVWVAVAPR